ncbi:MAG: hypothetical protein U9R19_18545 [Bacteroidota bacterium]|nr:hypothetical protein [Bacteroidota bacterium]
MKKTTLLIGIIVLLASLAFSAHSQSKEFSPSGTVYGRVFSNFHGALMGEGQSSAFEIIQAYFGYKYKMSEYFSAEIKLDIGDEEGGEYSKLKRYAYFKKAELKFHKNNFTVRFGIISMKQFGLQEKFWEKKYVKKSYVDYYKLGQSADIGAAISYDILPNLSVDALMMNGEGYKKLQSDDTYKGGYGVTYLPLRELTIRYYSDHAHKKNWQSSYAGFVGYKKKGVFSIAAEYNYVLNNDFDQDYNWGGMSLYGSFNFAKQWEIFARIDQLTSNKPGNNSQAWNSATETVPYPRSDGNYFIGGIQFMPIKKVRLAIDGQYYKPAILTDDAALMGFLHCQFDL